MGIAPIGGVSHAATTHRARPVAAPTATAVPEAPVSTSDQAPALAASALLTARLPDAALVGMMQSLAGLTSGVMA